MTDPIWYLVGAGLATLLALVHATVDGWLYNLPRPLPRRGRLLLAARWSFLATVLVYAWLIDNHRVPYSEPGIWLLFGAGGILTVALALVALRGEV